MKYPFDDDISIDIETTGKKPGCGILSIGACSLDCTKVFYVRIDPRSNLRVGLVSSPDTLRWWSEQSVEAREEAFSGTVNIYVALTDFAEWYKSTGAKANWGNGACFDQPILVAAFDACDIPVPWEFWEQLCYRTMKVQHKHISEGRFEGVKHNALADATHQAKYLRKILINNYERQLLCTMNIFQKFLYACKKRFKITRSC